MRIHAKKSERSLSLLLLCAILFPLFSCFAFLMPAAAEEATGITNLFEVQGAGIPNTTLNGTFISAGYIGSKAIEVQEGDVLYWGPARLNQSWHVRAYNAEGNEAYCVGRGKIPSNTSATLHETITDNLGILKYKVPAGVTHVRITSDLVNNTFVATLNQPFSAKTCYENLFVYGGDGIPNTTLNATFISSGGWYGSEAIPVKEGDVVYYAGGLSQGWHIGVYNASGTRVDTPKLTTAVHAAFTNTAYGVMKYTIPAGKEVTHIRVASCFPTFNVAVTVNQPFDEAIYNKLFAGNENLFESDGVGIPNTSLDATFLTGYPDYVGSKAIPVKTGDVLYFGMIDLTQSWHVAGYDANGTRTVTPKLTDKVAVSPENANYGIAKYTVPSGIKHIRFTSRQTSMPTVITKNYPLDLAGYEALVNQTVAGIDNLFRVESVGIPNPTTINDLNKGVTTYVTSTAIPVQAGDEFYFGPCSIVKTENGHQTWFGMAYDANGNSIGKIARDTVNGTYVTTDHITASEPILKWVAPEGVASVRFLTNNLTANTFLTKNQSIDQALYNLLTEDPENLYVPHSYGYANTTVAAPVFGTYSYATGEIIPVKEGDKVYFGPYLTTQSFALIAYDATGAMLDEKATLSNSVIYDTLEDGSKIICWTVPAGATQMRATTAAAVAKTALLTINRPFDRLQYNEYATAHIANNYGHGTEPKESVLSGLDALFVGDSITYGSYDVMAPSQATSWAGRLAANTGLNVVNAGVGGATLAQVSGKGWIYNQLNSNKDKDFDLIVMHGGINDSRNSVEIGTPTYSNDPTVLQANLSTYAGGLEWLFYNATQNWPDAERFYIANFRVGDTTGRVQEIGEYFEVAKEICKEYGVTYIDLYDNEELTAKLQPTTRTYMADLLHPSSKGYDIIFPYVLAPIEERIAQDNYMDSILTTQVNINAEKTLRFLTTVDHLDYSTVGFLITRMSDCKNAQVSTTTVYQSVLVDSTTVVASDISGLADSKYIALYHVSGIHSETEIKVRAFVVTQDGQTVYGDTLTVTIP